MASGLSIPAPALPAQEPALCLHCRAPVLGSGEFCCHGCEHVFELLRSAGLDRYYALRGDNALAPVAERPVLRDEAWLEAHEVRSAGQSLRRIALDVQGVQCAACVWLIEALFKREPGALRIDLNPALGRLTLMVDAHFALRAFVHTVEDFGYRLGPASKHAEPARDTLLLRTGICAALAVNAMLLGAATYFGLSAGPLFELVQHASFVLATLSVLVGGSYFADRAWLSLKRRVLHLDLPIAVGMGLAYLGSVWSLYFGGARASYLDTVSVFIALMLVGRLVQERLVDKNRRQLLASDGASGLLTRRIRDGRAELVGCPQIAGGDRLLVCPGEIVPVHARLEEDEAECTLDWINGESEPRRFARGDELVAGSINAGRSALTVTALAAFERSELDALLRSDERQSAHVAGDFWDRLGRVYVAAVLVAAALGALIWILRGGALADILDVATAILVVTCPCAFGIATPLAYELAVSSLRQRGLFVRDGGFFDRAARVKRIVFDKTGTLTTGALELAEPDCLLALSASERAALYDLSVRSNHPKSSAIARALLALDANLALRDLTVVEVPGKGMEAVIEGARYRLGAARWAENPCALPAEHAPVLTRDGLRILALHTRELARPHAAREVQQLAHDGYELWIASGDVDARVKTIARELGVSAAHALGDLSPEGKRALIDQLDRRDTLMLGDGINDGPALSRALCSGTPAEDRRFVPARADFYFLTAGLHPIREALFTARRVRAVIRRALGFATLYNLLAVGLACAGLMRPWLAAVLMPASSILVLSYTALAMSSRRLAWKP
jgi:Cu2+-exporting ATPase